MKRDTTMGLDPDKVSRLLGIARDSDVNTDGAGSAEDVAQLLDAYLAAPAHTDEAVDLKLVASGGEASGGGPVSVGEVLTSSRSPLETLRSIRQRAKRESSSESSEAEQATATTLYFAAIANALVFHSTRLTTHSGESLGRSFDDLRRKPWMPKNLVDLFSRARDICRDRQ
jgi:hypothetical protein